MIDLTQPPNVINREILKLPYAEQEEWINKWMSQTKEANVGIPKSAPLLNNKNLAEIPESTTDAMDRPRRGKFGRKERQEYAKNKSETEMKEFLQNPIKVKQASTAFRNKIKNDLERIGLR